MSDHPGGPATLPDWLARRALTHAGQPALIAGPVTWTFAELAERVGATAHRLAAHGVGHGDRVALLAGNSPDFVLLAHALGRLGAILVPLNVRLAPEELAWLLADVKARLLLHDAAHAVAAAVAVGELARNDRAGGSGGGPHPPPGPLPLPILGEGGGESRRGPSRSGVGQAGEGEDRSRLPLLQLGPDGATGSVDQAQVAATIASAATSGTPIAHLPLPLPGLGEGGGRGVGEGRLRLDAAHSIIYTSGTTGRPKGAMLTYGNHWWSATASALHLGLHRDDRWLAPLPLFHVGGLAILMRGAIYGIPVVLHESFDPERVNRALDREGVTLVSVVATMLERMLDARGDRPYPATLRCVLLGGGPAPRPLLERCAALGVPVAQSYGLTEATSQVATLLPEEALRKLGSAGRPLPVTEVRIVDTQGGGRAVPAGEEGEIVVRGPTVTPGYVDRPEETARAIRDGWLYTGDYGRLDEEGYLYVLDRRDDLIVSGGENIYPAEVEAVLLAHPGVADAAVVGVPDARWGQAPVAVVQRRQGARVGEAELRAHCADRLAPYKRPRAIRWADGLPRNAAGKLLRRQLRDSLASPGAAG